LPIALEADGKANDGAVVEAGINEREDIQALKRKMESLSKNAGSIVAEQRRPNIDFVVQHIERRGVSLFPDRENAAAIQISIPLFNAGTTEPRQLALLREREALEAAGVDLKRTANLEIERARAAFFTAQSLRKQAEIGVESASENADTRRAQYDMGRLQVDDLLIAESELEGQKALIETAAVDIVRAWLSYQFAMGRPMTSLAIPSAQ
jgi:outer membrane protein TolC